MRATERCIRIDPATWDDEEIGVIVGRGDLVVVQFSQADYDAASLDALDARCRQFGERIEVRFYGHAFDCKMLARLPQVRRLSLDCLDTVGNFTALQELEHLEHLTVGIFEFEEPDFLAWPNLHDLTGLTLGSTRRADINLDHLRHFRQLRQLFVGGHTRNIAALGSVSSLSDLTLRIPGTTSIAFINTLPQLTRLAFILGGRSNLDELATCPIEELEIIRVKGFERLDRLTRFPRLQRIDIEDQLRLTRLSIDAELPDLARLRIVNCKAFAQLDGLHLLPHLGTLWLHSTALNFDELFGQQMPGRLQRVGFYTGRTRADAALRLRLEHMGYQVGLSGG
jgi:protein phosphatase 1 regulatory subunit 7